ncbi:hypothetical protein B0H17DRAFT_17149 [Mycena rosella]|uniref:DUF6533 domain-containing protein n=1 Tax=Mycena rosella TaxID=1033263 RepID=A0AAD7D8U4_MYCRO|nr:hypothetical protein B0H17DRAFT_17149 [Mycena rosella]
MLRGCGISAHIRPPIPMAGYKDASVEHPIPWIPMATTSVQIGAYLRVAAYAIAFFDYLQSLPAEYRLYAKQKGPLKLSVACTLFILVRYLGLISVILGNTGFFYHGFSKEACARYFWATPTFKLLLYMTSQTILAIRTYAVSRKSPMVLRVLVGLFILAAVLEFISTFWKRVPFQKNFNCTSGNLPGVKVASLYYIGGLVFDVVTMIITFAYLWKFSRTSRTSVGQLARMMLEDGVMYFLALSGMNIVNLIFFQSRDIVLQTSASTLGIAATMIFSSRFILNLSEHLRDGVSGNHSITSGTPAHHGAAGFRGANHAVGEGSELAIKVEKNVITMNDMGRVSRDTESEPQMKDGAQWGADGSIA